MIASGINTKEFVFIGFLPVNKKEKIKKLEEIKLYKQTIIFYEAPHKLLNTLEIIKEVLGDRNIVLARELTKIHEEFLRGKISQIQENMKEAKGEYVVIVEGSKIDLEEENINILKELSLEEHYKYYENLKYEKKEIIKKIAKDRNTNKNDIYQYFVKNNK